MKVYGHKHLGYGQLFYVPVIHDLPPFFSVLLNQKLKCDKVGKTHSKGNNIIAQSIVNRETHIKQ